MFEFIMLTSIGFKTMLYNDIDDGNLDAICFGWDVVDVSSIEEEVVEHEYH